MNNPMASMRSAICLKYVLRSAFRFLMVLFIPAVAYTAARIVHVFAGYSYLAVERAPAHGWAGNLCVNITTHFGVFASVWGHSWTYKPRVSGPWHISDEGWTLYQFFFGPRFFVPVGCISAFVQGAFAYEWGTYSGRHIVDYTDPSHPVEMRTPASPAKNYGLALEIVYSLRRFGENPNAHLRLQVGMVVKFG